MSRIFQEFKLVVKKERKERAKVNLSEKHSAWKEIIKALKAEGFTVMCSQNIIEELPTVVIVGAKENSKLLPKIKEFFYNLIAQQNLPFRSGEWYMEE
jgi:hypothetical protein